MAQKTPLEVYEHYRIMPGLQQHQLRVAAVARLLCDHMTEPVDTHATVVACLFHDMGNIIKSDLARFPSFLGDYSQDYWEGVKRDFIAAYGGNAHAATIAIMREMNLPTHIVDIDDSLGFSRLVAIRDSSSYEKKIAEYSDARVAPFGVLSLEARLADARERYRDQRAWAAEGEGDGFELFAAAAADIERQIMAATRMQPEAITDEAIAPIMAHLDEYLIEVRL